jgi:hypothetical protein
LRGEIVNAYADMCRHVSKVSDAVETTAQVAPNWFDLSDAEEDWVHESEDVKAISLAEKVRTPCVSIGIGRHSHTRLKLVYVVIAVSPGLSLAIVVEKVEVDVVPGHVIEMASFGVLAAMGWHRVGMAL